MSTGKTSVSRARIAWNPNAKHGPHGWSQSLPNMLRDALRSAERFRRLRSFFCVLVHAQFSLILELRAKTDFLHGLEVEMVEHRNYRFRRA
jgi:hypothetical protein